MFFAVFFLAVVAGSLFSTPSIVDANVIVSGSFENGITPFVSNYGGVDVVTDATAPDGGHSLRFNFPAGCCDGSAPDIITTNPEFFSDEEEIYIQFYLKYSSNWVDQAATNKWVYIWFGDGYNKPNLPVMGHSQWYPQGSWAVLQAPAPPYYEQVWVSNRDFTYGVWHKMVVRVKMNTAGVANGILQMWQDDVLILDADDGFFRASGDTYGITSFQMTPVYGGGGSTPPADQYMWFDDVIVQTTPIDEGTTPTPSQYCGDQTCNNGETCSTCASDCGSCFEPPPATGDPGTVNNLSATASGTNTVTLSFTEVDDSTGTPAKYDIRYDTPTIAWGNSSIVTSGTCATPVSGTTIGATKTCTITGLNPDTQYQFQLVSYRGTLNQDAVFGGLSNAVSVTTTAENKTYNLSDFTNLVADWLKSIFGSPADTNLDNKVNSRDLGIMMSNWETSSPAPTPAPIPQETCGNGTCASSESCSSCPGDCGSCPVPPPPSPTPTGEITRNRMNALEDPTGWYLQAWDPSNPAAIVSSDSPEGGTMCRITIPEGTGDGSETADIFFIAPSAISEAYIQFYHKYSSNYEWHPIGNKIMYFYSADGTNQSNGAFTENYGDLKFEVYGANQDLTQYYTGIGRPEVGVWYKYNIHTKANTSPGSHDGILQVWVNDVLKINQGDIMWFASGTTVTGWGQIDLAPAYGGGGGSNPVTSYVYYDDVWISTTPF